MDSSLAADRFRATADLADTGVELQRQNLRRAHPDAGEVEIDRLLVTWLRNRPSHRPDGP